MQSSLLLPHYLGLSYGHFIPSVSFFVSTLVSFINSASSGLIQQSLGQDLTQRGVFEKARWRKEGGREGWKEVRVNIYGLTISVWVGGRESERAWQREECAQRARSGRAQGGFVWETRESHLDWNIEFWGQQMSKGRQKPDLEGPWARGEHSRGPLERFQVGEDVTTDAINWITSFEIPFVNEERLLSSDVFL